MTVKKEYIRVEVISWHDTTVGDTPEVRDMMIKIPDYTSLGEEELEDFKQATAKAMSKLYGDFDEGKPTVYIDDVEYGV